MQRKRPTRNPATYKHAPHIAWRRVEEEAVLLNVDTSEYYSLGPVAAEIWDQLGKGNSVGEVIRSLSESYGEPQARVSKDTEKLLENLLQEKLLVPSEKT